MTKTSAYGYAKRLQAKGYEVTVRDDYSGRGMYGRKTFGIVTCYDAINACPGLKKVAIDNMGLDYIFY